MFYFLLGFVFGCITGYISNKQIQFEITYTKKNKDKKGK